MKHVHKDDVPNKTRIFGGDFPLPGLTLWDNPGIFQSAMDPSPI